MISNSSFIYFINTNNIFVKDKSSKTKKTYSQGRLNLLFLHSCRDVEKRASSVFYKFNDEINDNLHQQVQYIQCSKKLKNVMSLKSC